MYKIRAINTLSNIRSTVLRCRKKQIPFGPFLRQWADFAKFSEQRPNEIRNIGISAHIGTGKTTLMERILLYTGKSETTHEVKGKGGVGATMDFMELERQRGITVKSAPTHILWKDHNINIIDTPGHADFTIEVERSLRVLDGAILVLCSVRGVQSQSITVNRQIRRYRMPCLAFINKLDRMGAKPDQVLKQLRTKLHHNAAFIQLPIGLEKDCEGVVDLVEQKAIYFDGKFGEELRYDEIPRHMRVESDARRAELLQHLTGRDVPFWQLYAQGKPVDVADIKAAIRRTCGNRSFTPVLLGTALKNKGVQPLLDAVVDYLPNPGEVLNYILEDLEGKKTKKVFLNSRRNDNKPFVALAFKLESDRYGQLTYMRCYQGKLQKGDHIYNARSREQMRVDRLVRMHSNKMEDVSEVYAGDIFAIFGVDCSSGDTFVKDLKQNFSLESMYIPEPVVSMAIQPANPKDRDNFAKAVARFTQEDPTFRMEFNVDNRQTIVSGMGELHLEVYAQRMESEYNCPVVMGKPKVSLRETLVSPCEFDYLHKKQSGGQSQYARVIGVLEPLPPEENTILKFTDETIGNDVPKQFIPGVKKGFHAMAENGMLAGQKLSGLKFRLQNGAHHKVDSSELAFFLAAQGAIRQVFENGVWQVLQPIMSVEIAAPMEYHDTITSQLEKRHGFINRISYNKEDWFTLHAEVPLNEMFGYAGELRSNTQGMGEFTMEYYRYSANLPDVTQGLIT